MITLTFGALAPRIIVGLNWTYAGSNVNPVNILAGQFTSDTANIIDTTIIVLSETLLGDFADTDSIWNFPDGTRLVFTDTNGTVSIFKWVTALVQSGPIIAAVTFESTKGTVWSGNYGLSFMYQTESVIPTDLGAINGSLVLTTNTLTYKAYEATLNGNIIVQEPMGVLPVAGAEISLWLKPTSSNRSLTMGIGILVPTLNPLFTFPMTLTQDLTYVLTLIFNGYRWMLQEITGGF